MSTCRGAAPSESAPTSPSRTFVTTRQYGRRVVVVATAATAALSLPLSLSLSDAADIAWFCFCAYDEEYGMTPHFDRDAVQRVHSHVLRRKCFLVWARGARTSKPLRRTRRCWIPQTWTRSQSSART